MVVLCQETSNIHDGPYGKYLYGQRISKEYVNCSKKQDRFSVKNKNIKFLGKISFKKKIEYLKNASALLFPIKWEEPFGLVPIEAMACGTPVIAFNRGSVPEIIKDGKTGFIVKNIWEMVRAIEKIPQISRKECRKWVEKKFTVQKMAEGYEKIYRSIIKKNEKR